MVMLTRVSWVVLVILATITVSESQDVIAKEGSSLFLECRGDVGKMCVWTASYPGGSSDSVAMSNNPYPDPRYHLTDSWQSGDCSLNITDIKSSDMGILTCTIKPNPPVIKYNVIVGTQPDDPLIEYKGQTLNDGDVVQIETPAEIKCIVSRGKPAAEITWEPENFPSNGTTLDNGDAIDAINTLKIENLPQDPKPEIKITCKAKHPLYPYFDHQKSITITVGEQYATTSVKVEQNTTYASCVADGIPRPTIQWQFRDTDADQWDDIATSQNITLENSGDYRCVARNDLNEASGVSSDVYTKNGEKVIHHPSEDNSKQAGVIAGVVVAVLVVLCIIGGLTLFTYRRKSLCFKERRPMTSNNPGNLENGGKIQTNDEKEKGEIKDGVNYAPHQQKDVDC